METLIRRRVLRRLIWVCTVCIPVCPTKKTLCLYELSTAFLGNEKNVSNSLHVIEIISYQRISDLHREGG